MGEAARPRAERRRIHQVLRPGTAFIPSYASSFHHLPAAGGVAGGHDAGDDFCAGAARPLATPLDQSCTALPAAPELHGRRSHLRWIVPNARLPAEQDVGHAGQQQSRALQ